MRIALFRPLGLASLLCAVPALRALDAAYPHAEITLIGLPRLRELAERLHRYLDGFAAFPGFPGIPGPECDLDEIPGFFERMRASRFDLAIQMHGSGEIANPLMVLMGAARNAGYYRPGRYCPDAQRYLEWREDEDDVQRWVRLAERLGAPDKGTFLEFPLAPEDWAEQRALHLENYVCLDRAAQPQRFAEVSDALAAEGWNVVPISLAERRSLGGTVAVIAKARLVVSNDPDTALLAAAMRTPTARNLSEARELLARAA
jgi:ADP-heptose:LPS heptosyltransferase